MKSAVEDDIVPRGFPKLRPEEAVATYLTSKSVAEQIVKYPEWDRSSTSVELELYFAKLELHLSQKRLAATRNKCARKRAHFDDQLAHLERKQKELQTSFKKLNEFIKTNQEKKERAQLKLAHEVELQRKRSDDIKILKVDIKDLAGVKSNMEDRNKEYRIYEDFLLNVVKLSSGQFKIPNDLIARYVALYSTRDNLAGKLQGKFDDYERAKTVLDKMLDENALKLLGLNNQVRELAVRYEKAKVNALLWETQVSQVYATALKMTRQYDCVRNSCRSIYKSLCARRSLEVNFENVSIEQQLVFIKNSLGQLSQFVRKCRKMT